MHMRRWRATRLVVRTITHSILACLMSLIWLLRYYVIVLFSAKRINKHSFFLSFFLYSIEYQSFCAVVWFGTTHPPPTQVGVGELHKQETERQRGEPKSYDSTETVVIYIIYYTPFSASLVQDDGNWRALRSIQRVWWKQEQRSCGGRGGGRAAPLFLGVNEPKRRVRAAHGRARAAKTN